MKASLLIISVLTLFNNSSFSQIGKIMKAKAEQRTEQAADMASNKLIDKITGKSKTSKSNDTIPVNSKSTGSSSSSTTVALDEPIPAIINFDWEVTQRMHKDEDDDDANNGKAYREVTYYFTTNGEYAAVKPDDASFSLMVYSKKGHTWLFDDAKKQITVMSMPKVVGEGGVMSKQVAEGIKKSPLQKDNEEEFVLSKTGKTKKIFNYTADEYQLKNKKILTTSSSSNTGAASFWYATVSFDPVKVYTMGAGRPTDLSKLKNDPKMKNNIMAIPVLNTNYLQVEMEAGGMKGLETTSIKKVNNTIYTAGYKIKMVNGLKDAIQKDNE